MTPPAAELPVLDANDVLRFQSPLDYAAHYRTHIAFGGVIARAAPRAIGSMHAVKLVVAGHVELPLRARVGFVGDGTLGLMIDSFPVEKPQLESLLARLGGS